MTATTATTATQTRWDGVCRIQKRVKPTAQQAWDRYVEMQREYAIWHNYEKMRFEKFLIAQARIAAMNKAGELLWDLRVGQWNEDLKPTREEVLDFVESKYAIPMPRAYAC